MPRLHVLGSGGWIPTLARQTCCYLLETRRALLFLDCGTGISRLHDPMFQAVLARHRRAAVLLSHWHHDHVEGLHALPYFLRHHEVTIAAPSREVSGFDPLEVLGRFGGKPLLPHPLPDWMDRFAGGFSVQELKPGANVVAGEDVEVAVQPHTDPSLGFRVRDLCYVTDTCDRAETAAFAEKAVILIHDAWLDREGIREDPEAARVHGTGEGAARLARDAGVQDLLLAHLNPAYDGARLERLLFEAAAVFPRASLASDMSVFRIAETGEEEAAAAPPGGDAEAARVADAGAEGLAAPA